MADTQSFTVVCSSLAQAPLTAEDVRAELKRRLEGFATVLCLSGDWPREDGNICRDPDHELESEEEQEEESGSEDECFFTPAASWREETPVRTDDIITPVKQSSGLCPSDEESPENTVLRRYPIVPQMAKI